MSESPETICAKTYNGLKSNSLAEKAWAKGVMLYLKDLLEILEYHAGLNGREPMDVNECRKWILNGAKDWNDFSHKKFSLTRDKDIAKRLCNISIESPRLSKCWADTQAKALEDASELLCYLYEEMKEEEAND